MDQSTTIATLTDASEAYFASLFDNTNRYTIHAKHATMMPKDT